MSRALMVQGTASGVGKTVLVAGLCRIFADRGYRVAPFKSQNMSNFSYAVSPGVEVARAQAVQAIGARCEITADLNPILLKPLGGYDVAVYVNGALHSGRMHAREYYRGFVRTEGFGHAAAALSSLQGSHDLVILEGAGSPAEVNLQRYDIANMRMAKEAGAAVLLAADIDRGGSFASLVGTMALIEDRYRQLVRGFLLNKFRGDAGILRPALERTRRITGVPFLGTIPMLEGIDIPEEDSLGAARPAEIAWTDGDVARIDRELDRIAKTILENVEIGAIEGMVK